ncbi:hypothetical protein FRIGORI9N_420103 [Frigoribacterium sp. 9N]|nr:hypothetical protein FRIGORI9N_420103 [Frigoribacterium sp. 9N]
MGDGVGAFDHGGGGGRRVRLVLGGEGDLVAAGEGLEAHRSVGPPGHGGPVDGDLRRCRSGDLHRDRAEVDRLERPSVEEEQIAPVAHERELLGVGRPVAAVHDGLDLRVVPVGRDGTHLEPVDPVAGRGIGHVGQQHVALGDLGAVEREGAFDLAGLDGAEVVADGRLGPVGGAHRGERHGTRHDQHEQQGCSTDQADQQSSTSCGLFGRPRCRGSRSLRVRELRGRLARGVVRLLVRPLRLSLVARLRRGAVELVPVAVRLVRVPLGLLPVRQSLVRERGGLLVAPGRCPVVLRLVVPLVVAVRSGLIGHDAPSIAVIRSAAYRWTGGARTPRGRAVPGRGSAGEGVLHVDGVVREPAGRVEPEGGGVVPFDVQRRGAGTALGEAREPGVDHRASESFALVVRRDADRVELPRLTLVELQPAEGQQVVAAPEQEEVVGVEPRLGLPGVEVRLDERALLGVVGERAGVEVEPGLVVDSRPERGDPVGVAEAGRTGFGGDVGTLLQQATGLGEAEARGEHAGAGVVTVCPEQQRALGLVDESLQQLGTATLSAVVGMHDELGLALAQHRRGVRIADDGRDARPDVDQGLVGERRAAVGRGGRSGERGHEGGAGRVGGVGHRDTVLTRRPPGRRRRRR